jgi:quinol monooxygenase YgiN
MMMFCAVYQWQVKVGMEEQFRQTWRTITEAIFAQNGSLGSRLHQNEDGTFVAYAQWPSRDLWAANAPTLGVDLARQERDACLVEGTAVTVVFKLTATDDLLRAGPIV